MRASRRDASAPSSPFIEKEHDLLRAHVRAGRDAVLAFVLFDQLQSIEILDG